MFFEGVLNHCVYWGYISDPVGRNKMKNEAKAAAEDSYLNEPGVYEVPDNVMERIQQNEAKSKPERSTGHLSSNYMSLKVNKEPEDVYQSLEHPNIHTVEYQNHAFISLRAKR